jgi:hypothetical protein
MVNIKASGDKKESSPQQIANAKKQAAKASEKSSPEDTFSTGTLVVTKKKVRVCVSTCSPFSSVLKKFSFASG